MRQQDLMVIAPLLLTPLLLTPLLLTPLGAAAQGIVQPMGDVAAGEHAEVLEDNPAGLAWGGPFELSYTFVESGERATDEGHAVFAQLGFLDPYHMGFGLQFLEDPALPSGGHDPVKISWGHTLRVGRALSLGLSWSGFVADNDPALDDTSTYDLGVQLRPWRWVALGLNVTDVGTPLRGGVPVERTWRSGLALRPGTDRITLSGAYDQPEQAGGDSTFGGRLDVRLFSGLGLYGRYDNAPAGATGDARVQRVFVGLTDQLAGFFSLGAFGYTPDAGAGDRRAGAAIVTRLTPLPEPTAATISGRMRGPLVVEVSLDGNMAEYASGGFFSSRPRTPFLRALRTLRRLGESDEVDAVVVSMSDPPVGWAQARELRYELERLRARGKRVFAFLTVADTRTYTIATAAEKIYMAPPGGLLTTGLRTAHLYIAGLLSKVGVQAQFVAIGDYKAAPEMFTRTGPSAPAREADDALLDTLYALTVDQIAAGRDLDPDQVRALIEAAPFTAQEAKDHGLIDEIIHYDELEDLMREALQGRPRFADASSVLARREGRWSELPRIAVLYGVGTITEGGSLVNPFTGAATVGAETFQLAVRRLSQDSRVKAVVLRIDSPGGSVGASDAMWRALRKLAEEKPVIVSLGDVAASGGYYLAVGGNSEILASPQTITGSIGIFTGKFDLSKLLWLLGVSKTVNKRGQHADLLSQVRPWSDEEVASVRRGMKTLYELFLERVAEGRPALSVEQVEPLAGGRVWTGAAALRNGLVDEAGGLLDAIDRAATRLGYESDDYKLVIEPKIDAFGGGPQSPIPVRLGAWLGALAGPSLAGRLPADLRTLLELPILHFRSGEALALMPFVALGP